MKKKFIVFSFIFWWTVMFPILNFTEGELVNIKNNTVQFKSFFWEILQ